MILIQILCTVVSLTPDMRYFKEGLIMKRQLQGIAVLLMSILPYHSLWQ